MGRLKAVLTSRVARGTAMGYYGQFVQILIQLASVPAFVAHWGLAGYGAWLMLFSLPGLLAMADLGFTVVGSNSMAAAVALGDDARAARIYAALKRLTWTSGAVVVLLTLVFLMAAPQEWLDLEARFRPDTVLPVAVILALYGVLGLANGATLAGLRAADAFASSGTIFHTIVLAEAACALLVLVAGGGAFAVALGYLAARLIGTFILSYLLRRKAAWLMHSDGRNAAEELRALMRPALAAAALPAGHMIVIQGSVMALGAIAGPAAVPVFTVTRTLSRTALQFCLRFSMATMPQFTVAAVRNDQDRIAQLVFLNILVSLVLIVPTAALMVLVGHEVIQIWTGGRVVPGALLLLFMAIAMVGSGIWMPLSNLLSAKNRHATFSYVFLMAAALAVALGTLLASRLGADGMGLSLIVLEFGMSGWVWVCCRAEGFVEQKSLWKAASKTLSPILNFRLALFQRNRSRD